MLMIKSIVLLLDLFLFLNKIVEEKIGNDYEYLFINLIFYFDDYFKYCMMV